MTCLPHLCHEVRALQTAHALLAPVLHLDPWPAIWDTPPSAPHGGPETHAQSRSALSSIRLSAVTKLRTLAREGWAYDERCRCFRPLIAGDCISGVAGPLALSDELRDVAAHGALIAFATALTKLLSVVY